MKFHVMMLDERLRFFLHIDYVAKIVSIGINHTFSIYVNKKIKHRVQDITNHEKDSFKPGKY